MNTDRSRFAPRTIAQARSHRTRHARTAVSSAIGGLIRRLRDFGRRLALDWQYQRELALLMQGSDRMLADIGLTRYDVAAAAQESRLWFGRQRALTVAALRREEAAAMSRARRNKLPKADAPPLAPALPQVLETSNFR
ncbi:MAG: DUF1127 domain-containing protein [Pseudorhodoplanes sp.]|uniref:DUF1127 domain-containing protein n=1 Tax=Pseudorhodoplanes sp. TaxID=1934341 RepID=UPI003D0FD1DD